VVSWSFSVPFFIVSEMGIFTPVISAVVALGYFGLDEVAEILESPFGNDPNDIHLRKYGVRLMRDLEMIYNNRDAKLDTVFPDEPVLSFAELLKGRFSDVNSEIKASQSARSISGRSCSSRLSTVAKTETSSGAKTATERESV